MATRRVTINDLRMKTPTNLADSGVFSGDSVRKVRAVAPATHPENDDGTVAREQGRSDPVAEVFAGGSSVRYSPGRMLGHGGMGAVRLYQDRWISRDVAIKQLRPDCAKRPSLRYRFLREAQIQGQLQHPGVLPVYDMGLTHEGDPYFTMRRLNGHTLEEIVEGLHDNDAGTLAHYSRRRILAALAQVCLTVAFAHNRGVVHRDLKPANIMLGDFGEVYVLDWGVAKLTGAELTIEMDANADDAEAAGHTSPGAILGTPGYMAPEQAAKADDVDGRSDVYALGAILFEVLTLEPLHPRDDVDRALESTMLGVDARPSSRKPRVPVRPELDDLCVRATSLERGERPTAREMADIIQSCLDGEQELEQRRTQAQRHTVSAQVSLALADRGGAGADKLRSKAMGELTRALALDPTHEPAVRTMMRAMVSSPDVLPPEAEERLRAVADRDRARAAGRAALTFLIWLALLPILYVLGVRDPVWFGVMALPVSVLVGLNAYLSKAGRATPGLNVLTIVLVFAAVASLGALVGPLGLVPAVSITAAATLMISLRADSRMRWFIGTLSVLAIGAPLSAQVLGWLPPSYAFASEGILVLPLAVDLPNVGTAIVIGAAIVMTLLAGNVLVARAVQALVEGERKLFARAWQTQQLMPAQRSRR